MIDPGPDYRHEICEGVIVCDFAHRRWTEQRHCCHAERNIERDCCRWIGSDDSICTWKEGSPNEIA